MRLGIDFGTTRIAVAAADRGNYPVVSFECPDGETRDWFPPLVAVRGSEICYGWAAHMSQTGDGWTVVRSLKRLLGRTGLNTPVQIGDRLIHMNRLLGGLTSTLRDELRERSNLRLDRGEPLEVMLGVPANSNSNQRFLTAEAFRLAGFSVIGVLNEPSAASIEFGHKQRLSDQVRERGCVLVYDLGGGTFDASLVEMDEQTHSVLASDGIETLGGDDFDEILAELVFERAGLSEADRDSLRQDELFRLHEECRLKKESIHPNSRRIAVDLDSVRAGWGEVAVPAAEFYEACRPLVQETMNTVENLLASHGLGTNDPRPAVEQYRLEAVYVTGGGSELPLVARELRERFDRRVRRSQHARSATAIGLAIQADVQSGYTLRDRFTRYFGVWREAQGGSTVWFDPLFQKGELLPGPGEWALEVNRRYSPVHNIGHFRYLECSRIGESGEPAGDITLWDEIRFPFDPVLEQRRDLDSVPVEHTEAARNQSIEEVYTCDAGGALGVTIANLSADYKRTYRLARWAAREAPVKPARRRPATRRIVSRS
ncbi:MAG TPA: Hsp70 family protein [Bryobacteraceae bacterium]|nr:Hsp70 family protein [Bryobacteraceae bacterium]